MTALTPIPIPWMAQEQRTKIKVSGNSNFNRKYKSGFQMELKLKENQAIGKINPDINKVKSKIAEQMALYRQKKLSFRG